VSGYGSATIGSAATSGKRWECASKTGAGGRRTSRGSESGESFWLLPALLGPARAKELQDDLLILRLLHVLFGFLLSFLLRNIFKRILAALSGDFSGHQI
jgi:hypothetical protein